jgi:hypothetical protein
MDRERVWTERRSATIVGRIRFSRDDSETRVGTTRHGRDAVTGREGAA